MSIGRVLSTTIVVFVCLFAGMIVKLKVGVLMDNNQPPASIDVVQVDAEIERIVETGSSVEIIDTEVTVTNNCHSSSPTEVQAQRVRTIEHLVNLEMAGGITVGDANLAALPILGLLKATIEGRYGIQDKQVEERSYSIKFVTNPHTSATHTLRWKYTWKEGQATVTTADGGTEVYTYRIRTTLEPETISEESPCLP